MERRMQMPIQKQTYPFLLPALPYAYDALEPYIDTETMHYHHDKHFQTYIDNLNRALKDYPRLQQMTLEELLQAHLPQDVQTTIKNNAGGVYNHAFFFNNLAPAAEKGVHMPQGALLEKINEAFGSFDAFKEAFEKSAASVFGSGWTFLALDNRGRLRIVNTKNQDTVVQMGMTPIIGADVWEHAYYLKYKNLRADYLKNLWNVIRFPVSI